MIFDIDDFPGKYAMHCKDAYEVEMFSYYLSEVGRTWSSGNSYLELSCYNENTTPHGICFSFNEGMWSGRDGNSDGGIEHEKSRGFKVLEFSDFEWGMNIHQEEDDSFNSIISSYSKKAVKLD